MSRFWNEKINSITPYVAGEQPKPGQKVIKLNTNENPYAPSPKVKDAILNFDISTLRLYPDTNGTSIVEAIAKVEGVKPSQVFVGNGSDEVLALCFQTFFEKQSNTDLPVLTPEFSYSFYPVFEDFYDLRPKKIALRENFKIDPQDYANEPNCGIAIANPNAPTSVAMSLDEISVICKANPDSVVLIDEAYVEFEEDLQSAVKLLPEFPNLCVVRTCSKSYSLAGLRVGYAIASEELIDGLNRAKDSFNSYPTDRLAQAIAAAAILDEEYHKECCQKIIDTRKETTKALEEMGFDVPDSSANFIFAKPPKELTAEDLYQKLRSEGILVRYFKTSGINDRLRITIGTPEEMKEFIAAVKKEVEDAKNS